MPQVHHTLGHPSEPHPHVFLLWKSYRKTRWRSTKSTSQCEIAMVSEGSILRMYRRDHCGFTTSLVIQITVCREDSNWTRHNSPSSSFKTKSSWSRSGHGGCIVKLNTSSFKQKRSNRLSGDCMRSGSSRIQKREPWKNVADR
jgi:arylamine N-acetyltransferase